MNENLSKIIDYMIDSIHKEDKTTKIAKRLYHNIIFIQNATDADIRIYNLGRDKDRIKDDPVLQKLEIINDYLAEQYNYCWLAPPETNRDYWDNGAIQIDAYRLQIYQRDMSL